MLAGEGKQKAPPPWPLQRLGATAAVLSLCGLGVWTLRQRVPSTNGAAPWASSVERVAVAGMQPDLSADLEAMLVEGTPESLEDALKLLEAGGGGMAEPTPEVGGKAAKKARTKVTGKAPKKARQATAEAAAKRAATETDEEERRRAREIIGNTLKKLTGGVDPLEQSGLGERLWGSGSAATGAEAAAKAAKKPRRKSAKQAAAEAAGPSEEDKRKARGIIRDTLKKLEAADAGEDSQKNSDLRDRLRALLGDEADAADGGEQEAAPDADAEPAGRKKKQSSKKAPPQPKDPEEEAHVEFVKLLKVESERKAEHTTVGVKAEFDEVFGTEARRLMCSGCKLVAARLTSELSVHDVHESDSPAQMIQAKRRAIDATCGSLKHLHVIRGDAGLRYEASEDGSDGVAPGASQRLCAALLEETRFELLTKLIQRKVPEMSHFHAPQAKSDNWERWLCAQRTRLCKRNEVKEDDEEEL